MESVTRSPPAPSAEVFVVPLEDNKHLVYAPLRKAAFVANAKTVNFLADIQDGTADLAADTDGSLTGFLRALEIVDTGPEPLPVTGFTGPPEPTAVTLFLTTGCNLRCTYCYASAGDTVLKSMPVSVAKQGIDYVIANAVKRGEDHIEIAYHGGGEPSVNWRVMTGSLAYAREKAAAAGIDVYASSASNGVMSDDKIDWVIENLTGVSLSFDGLPSAHDTHRVTASGAGSSDRVMHTMRRFDEAGFGYGVRVTVTKDQIAQLPDSVAYIFANFGPQRVQVEPAYQLGRWREAPSSETQGFIEAYREAQRRAVAFGGEITFSAARLGSLSNHFCGVTQDSFCLSPDGNVSGCYESFSEDVEFADTFFYGRPDGAGGYEFNMDALEHLRGQAVQYRDYCQGCFAKWTCGGDCYNKSLSVNGPGEFRGSDRCHITRELTKDQILSAIAASGGQFWHAAPDDEEDDLCEEAAS